MTDDGNGKMQDASASVSVKCECTIPIPYTMVLLHNNIRIYGFPKKMADMMVLTRSYYYRLVSISVCPLL